MPTLQGYEDAGDFTVSKRLKTSIHQNFSFYGAVGFVGSVGVLIMIFMNKLHWYGPHHFVSQESGDLISRVSLISCCSVLLSRFLTF